MNFEEPPVATTCDTCRYIAEQGGTTTALDAYEVLRRTQANLHERIAELEAELAEKDNYRNDALGLYAATHTELDTCRARVAALEAERDQWCKAFGKLEAESAKLEAERDIARADERHVVNVLKTFRKDVIELEARVAQLRIASRHSQCACIDCEAARVEAKP